MSSILKQLNTEVNSFISLSEHFKGRKIPKLRRLEFLPILNYGACFKVNDGYLKYDYPTYTTCTSFKHF